MGHGTRGTPSAPSPATDRPAGQELLARRARGPFYCVQDAPTTSGWSGRRCSTPATRCSSSGGTSSPASICCPAPPSVRRADATRRAARLHRPRRPRTALLHPDLGLRRALHARARSVVAMAAGWRMPRRVRFGFDDRHPVGGSHHPEDRRRRRPARLLRRHRSDRPSLGHQRASPRGAGADVGDGQAVRAVSRSPGHGDGTGRGEPRRARPRSLARAGRGAMPPVARPPTISGHPTSLPISPTSTSRSPGPCPARTRSRRSASARRCFSIRLRARSSRSTSRASTSPTTRSPSAGRATEGAGRPRDRGRLAEGMPRLARTEHDGRLP